MNVRKHYTWDSHAKKYVAEIKKTIRSAGKTGIDIARPTDAIGRRLMNLQFFIISDVDNTLIGDNNPELSTFFSLIKERRESIGFGIATGRTVESAVKYLKDYSIDPPDIIISSVGSELYYGKELHYSNGWATHISKSWNRDKIMSLLSQFDFLEYQSADTQRKFKVSYDMAPGKDRLAQVHHQLLKNKCRYNLIYSHNQYLDILPYRASKGKAIRYLSYKWGIPLSNFLVCGDSGNDEEMLKGDIKGIVVGNYSPELVHLKGRRNVYFAESKYAGGILEGIKHYRFIDGAY